MPTNDHEMNQYEEPPVNPDAPGYETTDVNIGGVIVFLAGLSGFLLIFFVFCFGMGRVINSALEKQDGPVNKWNQLAGFPGAKGAKRQNLESNAALEQKELQQVTGAFPTPRLETDDGEQDTSDLHAREDLLLEHYSSTPGEDGIRIPIERAMQLIAQRGLPLAPKPTNEAPLLAHDTRPTITAPLTDGFARTGYELNEMEAREQKMAYGGALAAENAGEAQTK